MHKSGLNISWRKPSVESLSIEVTTYCNSDCPHCFVRTAKAECSELSEPVVKDIIFEGFDLGYRYLHLTGGEPFLWNGIFRSLDYTSSLGYDRILINTNGSMLTDGCINRLSEYDGLSVSVSLDGLEPQHDHKRGKGSYRRTLQSVDKALAADIDLYIYTTVSKSLLPVLPSFADEIYKKFSSIKSITLIQLIRASGDFFNLSHELLDPDDFLRLVRMVSLLNLCGYKTEILNNPLATVVSELHEIPALPRSVPLSRKGHLIIKADRNISVSHSTRTSLGKYKFGKLREVLDSDEYRLATTPDDITCPACPYVELCRENGMIYPSEWYRDMYPEIPYCKRVLDRAGL